jgi:hypothetical protein
MIQRIQSIFLAVVVVLAGLSFAFPVWTGEVGPGAFTVGNLNVQYNASVPLVSGKSIDINKDTVSTWYCALMAGSVGLLALFTVIKFNNRIFQNQLCHFGSLVSVFWLAAYYIAILKAKEDLLAPESGSYGISFYLPVLAIVLFQAAGFYIRKDEELVRSADRIR